MRDFFVKAQKLFLCLILMLPLDFCLIKVNAEENEEDGDGFAQTVQLEYEWSDFLNQFDEEESLSEIIEEQAQYGIMMLADMYKSRRICKHILGNGSKEESYITMMYIDGQLAYCIEPYALIPGGVGTTTPGYNGQSAISYDDLSYEAKTRMWLSAYYGYGYDQDYSDAMFVATQLEIWAATGYPDEQADIDVSEKQALIRKRVAERPDQKEVSFNGQTIRLTTGQESVLRDENGMLSGYGIGSIKGISLWADGNDLHIILQDPSDFEKSFTVSGGVWNALSTAVIWKKAGSQTMMSKGNRQPLQTLSLYFELDTVPFTIVKRDFSTGSTPQGEAVLQGAKIQIINRADGSEAAVVELKDSDTITVDHLPAGEYSACEIEAPKGYLINTQCVDFSTLSRQPVQVEIRDEVIKGRIEIVKLDEETNTAPLDDALFNVFDSSNEIVDTITVKQGKGISQPLPYGHYRIKEVSAPTGYMINELEFEAFICEAEQVYQIEVKDTPQKGRIRITKVDAETEDEAQGDASLDHVVYELFAEEEIKGFDGKIWYAKDESVERIQAIGKEAESSLLPLGKYRLCESVPSVGYTLNPSCKLVELTAQDQTKQIDEQSVRYENDVIVGRIAITKFISNDGAADEMSESGNSGIVKPAKGFTFDVYLKSTQEKVSEITTDENGYAETDFLPYGRYLVKEREKEGFETAKAFEVMIDEDEKTYSYIIENAVFSAELTIVKVDRETQKKIPLAGASFRIRSAQGDYIKQVITYPQKTETDIFTTDETGTVHLPERLSYGTYTLCELHAPYGYMLEQDEIEFQVDGSSKEISIEFADQAAKGQLLIEKKGEVLIGFDEVDTLYGTAYVPLFQEQYLDDVTYRIVAREDIIGIEGTLWYAKGEVVEELTTHAEGPTYSSKLPLGAYSLYEIKAKDGYVIDDTVYDFDLTYEDENTAVVIAAQTHFNDRKQARFRFVKQFEDSYFSDPVQACDETVFGLYNSEDILVSDQKVLPAASFLGYCLLDKEGNGVFDIKLRGKYFIKELSSGSGYEQSEALFEFTFDDSTADQKITVLTYEKPIINYTKKGSLKIIKRDEFYEDYQEELYTKEGFVFEIALDKQFNKIVAKNQTDETGTVLFEDLEVGTYYVREIYANAPYAVSEQIVTVNIRHDEETTLDFGNKRRTLCLKIVKRDEENEQLLLKDAGFEITDLRTNEVVYDGKTDENGTLEIPDLKLMERYMICETSFPKGYTYTGNENACVIWQAKESDEPIAQIVWENRREKGELHLIKTDEYGKPVAQVVFEMSAYEDFREVFDIVCTDENGEIRLNGIPTGQYFLREIECPDPFELNEEIVSVDILADKTAEIVFENRYRNVDLLITKTDEEHNLLNDAEFMVADVTDVKSQKEYFLTAAAEVSLADLFDEKTVLCSSSDGVVSIEGKQITGLNEGTAVISAIDQNGILKGMILVRCVNYQKEGQSFWMEENPIDDPSEICVIDLNSDWMFAGSTGQILLRVVDEENHNDPLKKKQVAFYNSADAENVLTVKMTDEMGIINLDDLAAGKYYYRASGSDEIKQVDVPKKEETEGMLRIQNLKWGRTYLVVETKLPQGTIYQGSPAFTVNMSLENKEEIKEVTVTNKIRKVSLKLIKEDEDTSERLNKAIFAIREAGSENWIEEKATGGLMMTNSSESYLLASDQQMNDVLMRLNPNDFNEILEYLDPGIYFLQAQSELMSEPQRICIEKGVLNFENLTVGSEYVIRETEAPSGYQKDDSEHIVLINPDYLHDQVEVKLTNKKGIIPNMSDRTAR